MTRSMNRPENSKHRSNGLGESFFHLLDYPVCMNQISRIEDHPTLSCLSSAGVRHNEGSVYKRQPGSPVARSVKLITKGSPAPTQQDCVSMLKKLLPKTSEEEEMSEVSLTVLIINANSYCNVIFSQNTDVHIYSTLSL